MSYRGHNFRLLTISPASYHYPFFLSGDVRGALRAWPLPKRHARLIANVHRHFREAFFSGQTLIATTQYPELTTYSLSHGIRTVLPHVNHATHIAYTPDRRMFATYGSTGSVEVWSATELSRKRILATNHGVVSHVEFVNNSEALVSAGRDGRLILWSTAGEPTELAHLGQPIKSFALGPTSRSVIMISSDGALWKTTEMEGATAIERASAAIARIRSSPNQTTIYLGSADGSIGRIEASNPALQMPIRDAGDTIDDITFSDSGDLVAIPAANGEIHIGARRIDPVSGSGTSWTTLHARSRGMAFTPDGLLVAACTDGSVVIYSSSRRQVFYLMVGAFDLTHVAVSGDAKVAIVLDTEGRIIQLDLDMVRAAIERNFLY